jgi:hypothetical protein
VGADGGHDPCRHQTAGGFKRVGHRITRDRRQGCSPGSAYEKVHVTVDDATRFSYVEVLADERRPRVIGFLSRAGAWFNGQGSRTGG